MDPTEGLPPVADDMPPADEAVPTEEVIPIGTVIPAEEATPTEAGELPAIGELLVDSSTGDTGRDDTTKELTPTGEPADEEALLRLAIAGIDVMLELDVAARATATELDAEAEGAMIAALDEIYAA